MYDIVITVQVCIVLVGNKIDKEDRIISTKEGEEKAQMWDAEFVGKFRLIYCMASTLG